MFGSSSWTGAAQQSFDKGPVSWMQTAGIDDKIRWVAYPEVHRIHRIRWNLITFLLHFI